MVNLCVIHRLQGLKCRSVTISLTMKYFCEVCDRTPISGLSVISKIVQFDRKELFSDATNAWN